MNRTLLGITGLTLALVLFLLVNVFSHAALTGSRLDLTEGQLFTLSQGSRNIMAALEEPVTLRFYFSEKTAAELPPIRSYGERVSGLLHEFVAASDGKLRLEERDPEPFSEEEDAAVEAGVQGVPLPGRGDERLYFGLIVSGSTDEREVIPFFNPNREQSVEYDIAKLIHKLGSTSRPVVAVLSSLPLEGQPAMPFPGAPPAVEPWFIVEQLQQLFDVRMLAPDATELPADCRLLMIVHPKELSERTLYAIDQFVLKGGHALVFTDPFCEADEPPEDPSNPMSRFMANRSSSLAPLYTAWGVQMLPDKVVGDRTFAQQVRAGSPSRPESIDYVAWLGLGPGAMDADDFVTADLGQLNLATAGILLPLQGAGTEFLPLIHSSTESMQIDVTRFQFPPDPKRLLTEFVPENTEFALAARVRGSVKTAFPDGRPKSDAALEPDPEDPTDETAADAEDDAPDPDFVAQSTVLINVILVADVDLLQDQWWVQVQNFFGQKLAQLTANNGDFVSNALDNLSGSNDLISVRSRRGYERPFERVEALRRDAEQRFLAKEQELQEKLKSTETRINELQSEKQDGSSLVLSPEQTAEIERFRAEQVDTRKQLRNVQHDLRKDIDRLQAVIQWINIGAVPALLVLVAIVLGVWQRQRVRE